MLLCAFALYCIVDDGHDWRGDFAMYISQAQSITDGTLLELYNKNVVTMQLSDTELGPYLYPMGFPLLLAPVLLIFGLNFYLLKALCCAALVLSIPLIYRILRPSISSAQLAILSVIPAIFYQEVITFGNSILSDLPFLFFSVLSLTVIERLTHDKWVNLLVGVLLYFTYSIRDVGIFLIPTLMVAQWQWSRHHFMPIDRLALVLPYLAFAALFVVFGMLLPPGQENHFVMLEESLNLRSVRIGMDYYTQLLGGMVGTESSFILVAVSVLVMVGIFRIFPSRPHLLMYALLNAMTLLFWSYKQGFRLLFPILPVLVLFFFSGMESACLLISPRKHLATLTATIVVGIFVLQNFGPIRSYADMETNQCYTKDHQDMYRFMKEKVPKDALVAHYYPRVLRLFTGINAARIDQYAFDIGTEATYYQNSRSFTDENVISKHTLIYQAGDEILLQRAP